MRLFRRHETAAPIPEPEKQRLGLSREELSEELGKLATGGDTLSGVLLDGEHWPTEGLSDRQIELLTSKLRKVQDKVKRGE